ncbi:periplasmic binding protein [Fibrella aestuarina BUZ 2]|uniref:Periplasmic binding protein n=1 Tax=Fibrella aestuarina BUZ 2 TaxID=1166018 RepID=I0KFF0_9BACT|nr:helical backbone metal receptor [Fibrella aestuarina]CCH02853.1 periplasmic binding protein [Fibrella aestuarina BUZ 2]
MSLAPQPRLVSLVPSQTELLFDLGLDEEVVGITKFCIHPADKVARKPQVGGTKNVQIEQVRALQPTLIIANKEENTRADVDALRAIAPVHVTDVVTLPDAYAMIREVGQLVGRSAQANQLAEQIEASLEGLARNVPNGRRPRVTYLIWRKPWMVATADTFIDAMLSQAGCDNAFASQTRYPVVSADELAAAQPDWVFLSSEPYPFKEKHIIELKAICPMARIRLVDGELFSWYGSRLLESATYLSSFFPYFTE